MKKVITYIDGFNLYFGLKRKNWRKYYWLDLNKLSANLLQENDLLSGIKYFSARISKPEDKRKRQQTYLEALETLENLEIFYGKYQFSPVRCWKCGYTYQQPSEKKTDVNIAVEMMSDAFTNKFDKAILITADNDLVPPIEKIKQLFPKKRIVVALPPGNFAKELEKSTSSFVIGKAQIRQSQFDDEILSMDNYLLKRPDVWK